MARVLRQFSTNGYKEDMRVITVLNLCSPKDQAVCWTQQGNKILYGIELNAFEYALAKSMLNKLDVRYD